MFLAILLTAQATSVGAGPVPAEVPIEVPACCRPADGRAGLVVAAAPPDEAPARTEVDRVLDLVERQSAGLKSYRGRVSMENYDDLADESERRFGRVWLVAPANGDASARQAAVVFDRIVESGGRVRERLEHWVYRDGVLSDYDHEAKRLVRRRIAEPGDRRDPLRLGEGPIPIPIGQRKADIVANFDATRAASIPTRITKASDGVVGVRLVPKATTPLAKDGDIDRIDYWIRSSDGEPVAVEMLEKDGDRITIRFLESAFNEPVDDEGRRWLDAPDVDPESWRIEDR